MYMVGINRPQASAIKHTKNLRITFSFISLGFLLGISSLALVASAEETTEESTVPEAVSERRAEAAEAAAARQETRAAAAAERKASLNERVQDRITNLAANTSNRMEAAASRLSQIADRIEARSAILSQNGADTDAANTRLDEARAEITAAKQSLAGIDEAIANVIGSEKPYQEWQTVRATYAEAKGHLLAARAALVETVALLKQAVSEAEFGNGVSDAVNNAPENYDPGPAENPEGLESYDPGPAETSEIE